MNISFVLRENGAFKSSYNVFDEDCDQHERIVVDGINLRHIEHVSYVLPEIEWLRTVCPEVVIIWYKAKDYNAHFDGISFEIISPESQVAYKLAWL